MIRHANKHINPKRLKLPAIISIDELKNLKQSKGKYACFIVDPNKKVIDVLEDRKYETLEAYFANIPREERLKVRVVSSDLYDPYRRLTKRVFPKAKVVADKFHFA